MTKEQQSDTVLVSKRMQKLAGMIQDEIVQATGGRNYAFVLTVFTPNAANYVSNGPRDTVKHDLQRVVDILNNSPKPEEVESPALSGGNQS